VRAVVLSHRSIAHELGLLEPWLDEVSGGRLERRYREDGAGVPDGEADLLVVLGSPASVADGHCSQAAADEVEQVRSWVTSDRPYLGICFGAQVLARALGGTVRRMPTTYRAYDTVPLADGAPAALAGPWVTWHEDAITSPADAEALVPLPHADTAFRRGRAWGVQSHVEVTADSLQRMLTALDVDPAEGDPVVATLRRAEASAEPPSARIQALLAAFATDAFG
jgi:GMP synthase-like glutamine amidotransferase